MKRKSPKQYTEDFKKEAINLVAEQGYTVLQAAIVGTVAKFK